MKCFRLVLTLVALCSLCLALGCGSGEKKQESKTAESKDTKTAVAPAAQQPATPAQPPVAQSTAGQTPGAQPATAAPQEQPPVQTATPAAPAQPQAQAAPAASTGAQPAQAATAQPAPAQSAPAAPAPAAATQTKPAAEPAAPAASAPKASEIAVQPVTSTAKSKNPPATPFISSSAKESGLSFGVDTMSSKTPVKPVAPATSAPAPQTATQAPAQAAKPEPAKTEPTKAPEKAAAQPAPAPQAAPPAAPPAAAQAAPGGAVSLASLAKTNKIEVVRRSPDKPLHPKAGEASQKFISFCERWIETLNKNYIHSERNVELVNKDGKYTARYTAIDMNSVRIEIKESAYDHTPFVGLLKYSETQLESEAASAQAAKSGKFNVVKRIGVTEIFRYTKDHWVE